MNENEFDLAYMAGLFDGEGMIGIYKTPCTECKLGFRLDPRVIIGNTDTRIDDVVDSFPIKFCRRRAKVTKGGKLYYEWTISRIRHILSFLRSIRPYLKLKADQADLMVEYCKSRLNKRYLPTELRGYTERELKIVKELIRARNNGVDFVGRGKEVS